MAWVDPRDLQVYILEDTQFGYSIPSLCSSSVSLHRPPYVVRSTAPTDCCRSAREQSGGSRACVVRWLLCGRTLPYLDDDISLFGSTHDDDDLRPSSAMLSSSSPCYTPRPYVRCASSRRTRTVTVGWHINPERAGGT